jgi:hypothetical protein
MEAALVLAEAVRLSLEAAWVALEKSGVPVAIIGGVALAAWDRMRYTRDVDLLVGGCLDDENRILEIMKHAGFRPQRDLPVIRLDPCRLIQFDYSPPETFLGIRVDVLLADSTYHQAALARRRPIRYPGLDREVHVVACDDLIIHKLLAGRVIDRADAAALARNNRDKLDVPYVVEWIKHFQLEREWNEIWDEAFPGESAPT